MNKLKIIFFLLIGIILSDDCTDQFACNYNQNAYIDDGSCFYGYECPIKDSYLTDGIDNDGDEIIDEDEIRGLDSNGSSFFPPGGTNIWEVSLYSNQSAGTTVSFKYYDDVSNTVIDLNETITFASGDIIANAFSPFDFTGSSCGDAPCDDADADGVCDDVDDCVGEFDECGVCNGDGIAEDACDCDGNVTDCAGDCGGDAVVDDCGVCNGFNADQDDCGVCNGGNADQDCAGECFGDAEIDDCGVCNGFNADQDDCGVCNGGNADQDDCGVCFGGNADQDDCGVCFGDNSSCSGCTDPTADNFDDTATIDDGTCVFASGPALFQFSQSTSQSFYFVFNANIQVAPGAGGQALAADDWLGAFKDLDGDGTGDVCVGAKKWDPSQCSG